jgi:hypothetical protein
MHRGAAENAQGALTQGHPGRSLSFMLQLHHLWFVNDFATGFVQCEKR